MFYITFSWLYSGVKIGELGERDFDSLSFSCKLKDEAGSVSFVTSPEFFSKAVNDIHAFANNAERAFASGFGLGVNVVSATNGLVVWSGFVTSVTLKDNFNLCEVKGVEFVKVFEHIPIASNFAPNNAVYQTSGAGATAKIVDFSSTSGIGVVRRLCTRWASFPNNFTSAPIGGSIKWTVDELEMTTVGDELHKFFNAYPKAVVRMVTSERASEVGSEYVRDWKVISSSFFDVYENDTFFRGVSDITIEYGGFPSVYTAVTGNKNSANNELTWYHTEIGHNDPFNLFALPTANIEKFQNISESAVLNKTALLKGSVLGGAYSLTLNFSDELLTSLTGAGFVRFHTLVGGKVWQFAGRYTGFEVDVESEVIKVDVTGVISALDGDLITAERLNKTHSVQDLIAQVVSNRRELTHINNPLF